jgi:hypothetical protein
LIINHLYILCLLTPNFLFMIYKLNRIFENLGLNSRTVFLLDGLGALLSTVLLVLLLAPFENIFGMSRKIVYQLSIPTLVFTVYSCGFYFLNMKNWKPYLKLIALANFIYCCVSFGLVIQQYSTLTILGIAYFLGEIGVVLLVIKIELMIIKQYSPQK